MKNKTILVVEDDNIIAFELQTRLEEQGYNVVGPYAYGEDVIENIDNLHIDLVLMDINLKGKLDGIQTAQIIKQKCKKPVIYLTAYADQNTLDRAKITEPYGYIIKPFEGRELYTNIEIALYKHDIEKKLIEREQNYRNIYDYAIEGIFRTSSEGKILKCNYALSKILGYESPEEVINTIKESGKQVWISPEQRANYVDLLDKHGILREFECQHKRKDGSIIWVSLSSRLVRDNQGNKLYYEGFIEDITEKKKAEEEKDRLIAIIEQSSDYIGTSDMQGNLLYHNPAAKVMVGLSEDSSLKGMKIEDLCPDRFLDLFFNEGLPTAIRDGKWQSEITLKHIDGHEVPVSHLLMVHKDKNGIPIYTSTVMRDLTEIKQAKENEINLRTMIDAVQNYGIFMIDTNGNVLNWNTGAENLKGYTADEIKGKNFSCFYPDEDVQNGKPAKELELAKAKGKYEDENWRVRKNGEKFWANVIITAIYNESNELLGFSKITRDLTERRLIEGTLLKSENMLQTVLDNFPGLVFWKDRQLCYLGCNQTFATSAGLKNPAEVVGKTDYEMPWTSTETINYLNDDKAVMESGKERLHIIETFNQFDGQVKWIDTSKLPLRDSNGQVIGVIGVSNDISTIKMVELELVNKNKELAFQNEEKEKRAEELIIAKEKAEENNKLKTAFLANMSHEIRTPMIGIIGYSKVLSESNISKKEKTEYAEAMNQSSKRLLNLLNNIIYCSQLESRQIEVENDKFYLNDIFYELYSKYSELALKNNNKLKVTIDYSDEESEIFCDEEKISLILSNILDNAIKYTKSGSIEFGYKGLQNEIKIFVKDTGIGISENYIPNIFEMFSQEDFSLNRSHEGAGIGLTIAKGLVELLGGEIFVESIINSGTTFTIIIPKFISDNIIKVTT